MNLKVYITTVLLFFSILGLYAQNTGKRVSLAFSDITLEDAIPRLEKASGYTFFYDAKNTDLKQKVSLSARNMPLKDVLQKVLEPTTLTFEITNTQIILFKKNTRPPQPDVEMLEVSGIVVDEERVPVIGAAITVDGMTIGTATDVDGKFTLKVPVGSTLIIKYLGHVTQTVKAAPGMTIVLAEDTRMLEEVVVVGYGTQKKANLIGAVSQITAEELKDRPVSSVGKALQGKIPNLNITYGSGLPGADTRLNIRGVNSISSGGSPMVLVDGVETNIDRINPNDVESISVLKDAASAAIYGARAGFGVVLITTKSNKDGKSRVTYNGRFSFSSPTAKTDFITTGYDAAVMVDEFQRSYNGSPYTKYDGDDFMELYKRRNDATENPERPWVTEKNGKYLYYGNFDWYEYLFDFSQPTWNHDISITGGTDKLNYLVSGSHFTKDGLYALNTDKYKTYNLNLKMTSQVKPWLKVTGSAMLYKSDYKSPGYDFEDGGNVPNLTFHAMPFVTPYNPDGSAVYTTQVAGSAPADGFAAMMAQGYSHSQAKQTQFRTSVGGVFSVFSGLDVTGNFTYMHYNREKLYRSANMTYSQTPNVIEKATTGFFSDKLRENNTIEEHFTYDLFATYDRKFNNHSFKAIAGMNHEKHTYKRIYAAKAGLQSNELNDLNLGTGVAESAGGQNRWAILGFFGRVSYDYQGKYLAEVNMRWDGTSRFPSGDRWGYFPSVGAGWRVSEESFFLPLRSHVDNVKIRASIGSLGNQAVTETQPYLQTLGPTLSTNYLMNGSRVYIVSLGDQQSGSLTWETIVTKNLGLDLGFFNNRLISTVDLYIRDTKDMLVPGKELPAVYGMSAPKENAADLRNKGYEITLGWQDKFQLANKPFSYNVSVSLADSKAKITKYDNPTNSLSDYIEGRDVGEIWGYHIEGIFRTDAEAARRDVDQSIVNPNIYNEAVGEYKRLQAGDLIYADLNGDKVIDNGTNTLDNPGDMRVIGNSRPRYHYGANIGISWAGVDVSAFFQGIGRQHIYPGANNMMFWGPYARPYSSFIPETFLTDVWSEDNPNAYYPKARGYAAQGSRSLAQQNDRYLQDLAYCRLKNLTVGYTLPAEFTSRFKVVNLRVYFSGDNLFTWTKLKSDYLDPEQMTTDSNGRVYPFSKVFSFGVDITF